MGPGRSLCCGDEKAQTKDPKKEICRLKVNWFFMITIAALYAISYTSVSSSFHQFITNPREQSINRSLPGTKELEPGLGENEAFYSWVITVFNIGAILGSLSGGLLLKWVPYWHLLLSSLCLHTLGYVLYAVATSGWLIMLSKLLSGVFIGAEMTLALAYFAESNSSYKTAITGLGEEESRANRMKHQLFALHSVGVNVGYIFGPGVAVIFAQFPINQFRSIAWYNVVAGLGIIVMQILIFRGESACNKLTNCSWKWKRNKVKQKTKTTASEKTKLSRITSLSVLVFLVVGRALLGFRFCVYETLFNPILSDSFGLTERDSSYFFFGLVAAQVCGTVILLVLQQLRLSNRVVAIIGLVMSIVGTLLMGDWQAARHDPCTDASLFHHPELLHTYTAHMHGVAESPLGVDIIPRDTGIHCERLNLSLSLRQHLEARTVEVYAYPNIVTAAGVMSYGCVEVDACPQCSVDQEEVYRTYSASATCLHLHINSKQQCLEMAPSLPWKLEPHPLSTMYSCTMPRSLFTYCLSAYRHTVEDGYASIEEYIADVHLQTIQIVEERVDLLAAQSCKHHSEGHCHWNPSSSVTHRHCEDCPPICRDCTNYLEFSQFTIAAAILLMSVPVARIPITSLISDIVSADEQGIVMGLAQALNAAARSVGPLWLDAAYEGIGKRTFLAMALCSACYSAILIGVLLLYSKLAPLPRSKSVADNDSKIELDYTTIKRIDSFSDSDFMP